ncbi:MAG: DNA primase, partial [Lachnospirales bacterium]
MHYPREVIDEIRFGNDIVDVISEYVKLTKRGSSYVGLCPFHKEKTPSFNVNGDDQFYYCFGCGAGGNVISFIMAHEGYNFTDAIDFLAKRINYTLPEMEYSDEFSKKLEIKKKLYEIHKIAARFYYDMLQSSSGKNAVSYLDKRQITIPIRRKFGLGYSPISKGSLYNKLKEEGFDDDIIFKSGLAYKKDDNTVYDKFFNRLMFPIIDVYGNIIGFGGRIIGDGQPKYLNSPETEIFTKSRNLYNLNLAKKSKIREFILVEGYMDAISIYQAGFKNVVASLGTAFNEKHAKVLKSYADSVILLFDSDEAGTKAILRAIPVLTGAGLKVKVVQVTDAKDPDEYIKKFGAAAFGELIKKANSHYIFQAEQIRKKYDLSLLEDRINFTEEIAKLMSGIENTIEADAYIKEISKITDIDINSIKSEISKLNNGVDTLLYRKRLNNAKNSVKDGVDTARKGLINILVSNRGLYKIFYDNVKPEFLVDTIYSKVLSIIYELYEHDKDAIPSDIVSRFENID